MAGMKCSRINLEMKEEKLNAKYYNSKAPEY